MYDVFYFFFMTERTPRSTRSATLFPDTTLFRSGRHADGRGLYLLVRPSGSRSWVLRTQVDGKRRDRGLGSTAKLSLAQARAKAVDLRTRMARDRKSTRLNSSHSCASRMPSSA